MCVQAQICGKERYEMEQNTNKTNANQRRFNSFSRCSTRFGVDACNKEVAVRTTVSETDKHACADKEVGAEREI